MNAGLSSCSTSRQVAGTSRLAGDSTGGHSVTRQCIKHRRCCPAQPSRANGSAVGARAPAVTNRGSWPPVIGQVLAGGTIAPTWDWTAIPDLFSGKAGYPEMNLQIAATPGGPRRGHRPGPVHGARHDTHTFVASGLKDLLVGLRAAADLGYIGVDGITIVPFRTPPSGQLHDSQAAFKPELSGIRVAAERAVASVKTWRMLSEEGDRHRAPICKYGGMLAAVTGLFFFSNYYNPYE